MGHIITFLVVLQFTLSESEFSIDFLDTAVDELLGLERNLILVSVGLTVVADSKLVEEVLTSCGRLVFKRNERDRGGLRRWLYRQVGLIHGSHRGWRQDSSNDGTVVILFLVHITVEGEMECSSRCLE